MSLRDGTDAAGFDPMTGRAMRRLAGSSTGGVAYPIQEQGSGFGRGYGRGGRHWHRLTGLTGRQLAAMNRLTGHPGLDWEFYDPPNMSAEQELSFLHNQTAGLENALDRITRRIKELETRISANPD